jgi:mycoredoxin
VKKSTITLYGTSWCADCIRAKNLLDSKEIAYTYIDISDDEEATMYVLDVNDGMQRIPVLKFPDGSLLIEPTNDELSKKLGV